MPGESYNEYGETNSETMKSEIDAVIEHAKLDLNNLQSEILNGSSKAESSINNFYRIEGEKMIFNLDQVKDYLQTVYQRLQGMKNQKFGEISKENNFKGTILAIQITLKAISSNSKNTKKYNIGKINGEYNDATKEAIKQFQTDQKLTRKDGKPGKETIGKLVKSLETLINNKRLEKSEEDVMRTDLKGIIEEVISGDSSPWIYTKDSKEAIVNYIMSGKLSTEKNNMIERNPMIEFQLNNLSKNQKGGKLKYLIDHANEPLKDSMQKIKKIKNEETEYGITTPRTFDKYTSGENLTQGQKDAMAEKLKQLGSPITVQMVQDSCKKTNVPVEYLLAFMQNDSRLGTSGKRAINNHNPGNVGNTDSGKNKYYSSREEGVLGCAEHLRDRISAYWKKFKRFPTVIEIAKGVAFKKGVYMTKKSGPSDVNTNLKNWVDRLRGK